MKSSKLLLKSLHCTMLSIVSPLICLRRKKKEKNYFFVTFSSCSLFRAACVQLDLRHKNDDVVRVEVNGHAHEQLDVLVAYLLQSVDVCLDAVPLLGVDEISCMGGHSTMPVCTVTKIIQ